MYRARREEDGTYTIRGVPVFAEVPKGVKGAPFDIDASWLNSALAKSRVRAKEGYLAPLHFEHHDGGERNFKAGHYALTRVGLIAVGGERKFALFADFKKLPEHAFAAIMAGEWPYRSVEIASYEEREIESIALLDDETPFHKFKLLNGESIDLEEGATQARPNLMPVGPIGFTKSKAGKYAGIFCFAEEPMKKLVLAGNPSAGFTMHDEEGEEFADEKLRGFEFSVQCTDGFHFQEDKDKDDKDDDGFPKTEAKLKAMLKAINAKLAKMADDDDDKKTTPVEVDEDKEKAKSNAADPETLAKYQMLKARLDRLEHEKVAEKTADAAIKELRGDGYHIATDMAASIHGYTKRGESEGLQSYIKTVRAGVKDGPATLEDSDVTETESEQVASFQKMGPKAYEAAQRANTTYDELVAGGLRQDGEDDRKRFITFSMRTAGFKVA